MEYYKKILGYKFIFVREIQAEKDSEGVIIKNYPQDTYKNSKKLILHKYGSGGFCRFKIDNYEDFAGKAGVYALYFNEQLKYIGKCEDIVQRFNVGYGHISPKNCYKGGQSTNCKINKAILAAIENSKKVFLYFLCSDNFTEIERDILISIGRDIEYNAQIPVIEKENNLELKYQKELVNDMIEIFEQANDNLLKDDISLFQERISERTICGALMLQLNKIINETIYKDYFTDVEYNRNFDGKIKTILLDSENVINITCDLIIHSRGTNKKQDNLIAIEIKKSTRPQKEKDNDRIRLKTLTRQSFDGVWSYDGESFPEHVCRYGLGIYYEVNFEKEEILLEYYSNGILFKKKTLINIFDTEKINTFSLETEDILNSLWADLLNKASMCKETMLTKNNKHFSIQVKSGKIYIIDKKRCLTKSEFRKIYDLVFKWIVDGKRAKEINNSFNSSYWYAIIKKFLV